MMAALNLQALAEISVERMLNTIAEGIAIALFSWIFLRAIQHQSSSTRFAVWFSALVGVTSLPLFEILIPGGPTGVAATAHSAIQLPVSWAVRIFLAWAVIAGVALVRVGIGFWQLRRLRQSCIPIDPAGLPPTLRSTLDQFSFARPLAICTSDRVRVPTAIGFLKPAVVMPAWAVQELSPDELRAVTLHELAHLRRWDDWTNLAQRILRALFFFHPAVWWIGNRLSLEREMACDDFVLASTSNPRTYAQCLISVAEKSFLRRSLALAQAAVGRLRHTSLRVSRILDQNRSGATRVWKPALGLLAAFSAVCLISLPRAPRLVAFEDRVPNLAAASTVQAASALGDSEHFGGKFVPATFRGPIQNAAAPKSPAVNRAIQRPGQNGNPIHGNTINKSSAPVQLPTKLVQPRASSPRLVQTNVTAASDDQAESVLLVMHTQAVDRSGQLIWSISVWHLTMFHPADNQPQIPAKST